MQSKPLMFLKRAVKYRGTQCLLWPFALNSKGYGSIGFQQLSFLTHRMVLMVSKGCPDNANLQAAHICGNRRCVNPRHLRWATSKENERDKVRHGKVAVGERNGKSKFSYTDILEIKLRFLWSRETQADLARRFGMSSAHVSDIVWGRVRSRE